MHFSNLEICQYRFYLVRNSVVFNVKEKVKYRKRVCFFGEKKTSEPVFGFQHYNRVASENNHSDVISVSSFGKFDSIVHNQIHEGIKSAKNSFDSPAAIDLQMDLKLTTFLKRPESKTVSSLFHLFVHVLFQFWGMCFAHFSKDLYFERFTLKNCVLFC